MKTKTVLLFTIPGCILLAGTGYFLFPSILSALIGHMRVSVSEITQQFSTRFIYALACMAILPLALITVTIVRQLNSKNFLIASGTILAGHILGMLVNGFRLRSIYSEINQISDIAAHTEWNSIRINEYSFAGMIITALIYAAMLYTKSTRRNS